MCTMEIGRFSRHGMVHHSFTDQIPIHDVSDYRVPPTLGGKTTGRNLIAVYLSSKAFFGSSVSKG